jgi:cytochrome c-type biogenesis protein CcmH/NrfF
MKTLVRDVSGRTALFTVLAIVAFALAIPFSMFLARTPAHLTQYERLGAEIGCTCGTCPLRPIATCGCGFADGMLARLSTEIADGKEDEQIMAVFVAEYGPSIKIKPEGSGFGLMAWVAPMVLLMVGAVVMSAVISHWRSKHATATADPEGAAAAVTAPDPEAAARPDHYRDIVEQELDALDD